MDDNYLYGITKYDGYYKYDSYYKVFKYKKGNRFVEITSIVPYTNMGSKWIKRELISDKYTIENLDNCEIKLIIKQATSRGVWERTSKAIKNVIRIDCFMDEKKYVEFLQLALIPLPTTGNKELKSVVEHIESRQK